MLLRVLLLYSRRRELLGRNLGRTLRYRKPSASAIMQGRVVTRTGVRYADAGGMEEL